jgi:hypothetical protein
MVAFGVPPPGKTLSERFKDFGDAALLAELGLGHNCCPTWDVESAGLVLFQGHGAGTAFDMWSALGRPMGHASARRASRAAGPARHPSGCRAMIGGGSSERVVRQEMRRRGIGAAGVTRRPNSK